jgi:hypothetical protein
MLTTWLSYGERFDVKIAISFEYFYTSIPIGEREYQFIMTHFGKAGRQHCPQTLLAQAQGPWSRYQGPRGVGTMILVVAIVNLSR